MTGSDWMEVLQDNDIHLKFLLGRPIHVEGMGDFYSPLLKDVIDITEDKYNTAISSILFKKSMLNDTNEEIDKLTEFQVLNSIVYHDEYYRSMFFNGLKLHFNNYPRLHESGYIYFDEFSEESILTEDKFNYIKSLVRIANNIQEEKEEESYVAGNDKARQFMEEQKKRKAMIAKLKKPKMNLHSIISAVGWKTQSFNFINQLNVYQLYDGYYRNQMLDNYNHTMSGIYAGTIDGSKIKTEDINWANIVNNK